MRAKYILPLVLVVFAFSIFSQPPQWQFVTFGGPNGGQVTLPIYTTQLVYQLNVSQNTSVQFIQITIPQSILQQQLQYCKTYDPFISNNISLLQCTFAYPAMAIVYNPASGSQVGYEVTYFIVPASYDNVTGLPNTFQIFLNNHIGTLSSSSSPVYYLYILYPSPYYISFESMFNPQSMPKCPSDLTYATSLNFNGGWCTNTGGFGGGFQSNNYPSYQYPYAQSPYYSGCGGVGGSTFIRYLYVTFNPQYPVLFATIALNAGYVTVMNPSTGQTRTLNIPRGSTLYDLRTVELSQGLDPNQWNVIVDVRDYAYVDYGWGGCGGFAVNGIYLQYVPQ